MYSDGELGSQTPMAALLFAAELMMLLGAVGFTWNRRWASGRIPLISAIAAALAAVNGIWAEVIQLDFLIGYFQTGGEGNPSLFKNLITAILLPLGLILVNLAMEGRQAPPKPGRWTATSTAGAFPALSTAFTVMWAVRSSWWPRSAASFI